MVERLAATFAASTKTRRFPAACWPMNSSSVFGRNAASRSSGRRSERGEAGDVGHFAAFLSAERTSWSSVASGPSSASALPTAAEASAGRKPRLSSRDRVLGMAAGGDRRGGGGAERDAAGLVLEFVDDALRELRADALGAADHPAVAAGGNCATRRRRRRRQDGEGDAGADPATPISSRNQSRSSAVEKPTRRIASWLTSISVCSTTSSPIAPSWDRVRVEAETR